MHCSSVATRQPRRPTITPRNIAKASASTADELRAAEIVILDVRKLCDFTDYMVLCTGESRRQLRAIQKRLHDELPPLGAPRPRPEGDETSSWLLLDFGSVVVHIFDPEARAFYDLELLWGDAPKVPWKPANSKR